MSNPKPKYEMGDLVTLDNKYFFIDGFLPEQEMINGHVIYSIYYYLKRVHPTGNPFIDEIIGYEEDLHFVCDAIQADDYIRNERPKTIKENLNMSATVYDYGGDRKKNNKDKNNRGINNQKQKEKQELKRRKNFKVKMDELLDEMSIAMKKDDRVRVNEIQSKLHNLSVIHKAGGYTQDDVEDGE